MKHFKLIKYLIKEFFGRILYRIEATTDSKWPKKGKLDGYIEKESALSANALVYDNAQVSGEARVCGNAKVYGNARVYDNTQVYGDAKVCCTAIANTKKITDNYDGYYTSHLKKVKSNDSCVDYAWWNKSPNSYDNKLTRTLSLLLIDEIIKTEECKNEDF